MDKLYHCTTPRKLQRYLQTGCILPPVRGWSNLNSARAWGRKTMRDIILVITPKVCYPLPDHKPRGHAYWTPEYIRSWEEVDNG